MNLVAYDRILHFVDERKIQLTNDQKGELLELCDKLPASEIIERVEFIRKISERQANATKKFMEKQLSDLLLDQRLTAVNLTIDQRNDYAKQRASSHKRNISAVIKLMNKERDREKTLREDEDELLRKNKWSLITQLKIASRRHRDKKKYNDNIKLLKKHFSKQFVSMISYEICQRNDKENKMSVIDKIITL